jgi:hypothetical protein
VTFIIVGAEVRRDILPRFRFPRGRQLGTAHESRIAGQAFRCRFQYVGSAAEAQSCWLVVADVQVGQAMAEHGSPGTASCYRPYAPCNAACVARPLSPKQLKPSRGGQIIMTLRLSRPRPAVRGGAVTAPA